MELENQSGITVTMNSSEFKVFRRIIRICGFWHPPRAHFAERVAYPLFVNLFLLTILVYDIAALIVTFKQDSNIPESFLELYFLRLMFRVWIWLCHVLTIKYFKTRGMEQNILGFEVHYDVIKDLKSASSCLNTIIFFSLMLAAFVIVMPLFVLWKLDPLLWLKVYGQPKMGTNYGPILFGDPFCLWDIPICISLIWIMFVLNKTLKIRLNNLLRMYRRWESQVEDAIEFHYQYYSQKIRKSSEALVPLFASHNIFMIITTPIIFHFYIQMIGNLAANKRLNFEWNVYQAVVFTLYLIALFLSWVVPMYLAQNLFVNEEEFASRVNDFCPTNMISNIDESIFRRTFSSRSELQKFVFYLNARKSGFSLGSYSFQVKMSYLSFYLGLIVLALRLIT